MFLQAGSDALGDWLVDICFEMNTCQFIQVDFQCQRTAAYMLPLKTLLVLWCCPSMLLLLQTLTQECCPALMALLPCLEPTIFVLLSLLMAANLSQGEPEAPGGTRAESQTAPKKRQPECISDSRAAPDQQQRCNTNVLCPAILRTGSGKQSNCKGKHG
jgi:hypothetical protein